MAEREERAINCFKCGGDGHFARNCPQSTILTIQIALEAAPATIAAKLVTSLGSALNLEADREEVREAENGEETVEDMAAMEIATEEPAEIGSATTARATAILPGTALPTKEDEETVETEEIAEEKLASRARRKAISPETALKETARTRTSATNATKSATWPEIAKVLSTRFSLIMIVNSSVAHLSIIILIWLGLYC